MSRLFVVVNLVCLVAWLRIAACQFVELQPWKAAEAALTVLPDTISLRAVDSRSLEVFCGHRVKLGLEVDDRMYDVMIGNDADFSKLEIPELMDNKGSVSLISEVMVDACALPDVTLAGPLEIEWTQPSRAQLMTPPEPYHIPDVERIIIEDGAHVKLSGLKELQLQDPISLDSLTEAYLNQVYGRRSDHQQFEHRLGLMQISTALQERARNGKGTPLRLQATSASSGFALHQLKEHAISIVETSPGTLKISPAKRDTGTSSQVRHPWMWPLPDASMRDLIPYEALLKEVLSNHWPEVRPGYSSLMLQTIHLQAVTLLHLEMEVRSQTGQTQIMDAHILMDNDQYVPVNAQIVNSDQYTTTISKSSLLDVMNNNFTDPEMPLYDIYV